LGFLFGRRGHGPWFLWPLGILFVVLMIRRRRSPRWFPVSRLVEAAGKLADGEYTVRVPDVERGPMREVIQSFNGMRRNCSSHPSSDGDGWQTSATSCAIP